MRRWSCSAALLSKERAHCAHASRLCLARCLASPALFLHRFPHTLQVRSSVAAFALVEASWCDFSWRLRWPRCVKLLLHMRQENCFCLRGC